MVRLRACFVYHKVARYNRITPSSIRLRQEEDAARKAADSAAAPISDQVLISDNLILAVSTGFVHL